MEELCMVQIQRDLCMKTRQVRIMQSRNVYEFIDYLESPLQKKKKIISKIRSNQRSKKLLGLDDQEQSN
jgi:hypothetical protein